MKLSDERFLLVLCLAFFAVVYAAGYPQHAFYGDENTYLGLGQQILEGGYSAGIADRGPVLPLMVSACYALGLDPFQVRFILPLIIGIAFIFTTYLLGRRFCRRPFIPAIVMLSFPFFWQWCPFVLVDILLGVFSMLSALYLYRGIEDSRGFLFHSMLFLSLAILTKVSAVILIPAFLIYLLFRKRLSLLKDRSFLRGLAVFIILITAALALTFLSSGSLGLNTRFMIVEQYLRIPAYYILNLALVPWSLLFLYGLCKTIRNREHDDRSYIFSLMAFLLILIFFHLLVWKEMRFLLFFMPLFAVVAERSLSPLSSRKAYSVAAIFFIAGFILSMLLLNAVSYVSWGQDIHTRELLSLPDESLIAFDLGYIYNKALMGRLIEMPANATGEWVMDSGADYLSLSIYGELGRNPDMSHYRPMLGPIDISFLEKERPKAILTWWPGYEFSSGIYQWAESNLPVHKRIQFEGQDVFIIYRVSQQPLSSNL